MKGDVELIINLDQRILIVEISYNPSRISYTGGVFMSDDANAQEIKIGNTTYNVRVFFEGKTALEDILFDRIMQELERENGLNPGLSACLSSD